VTACGRRRGDRVRAEHRFSASRATTRLTRKCCVTALNWLGGFPGLLRCFFSISALKDGIRLGTAAD
jgi:hypothetical protein